VQFELGQNYPNPFNPETTIRYQLPFPGQVDLNIYSVLGEHVATLVSDNLSVGYYSVSWNASGFTSGIYYYRLNVKNRDTIARPFVKTRKLVLLR